MNSRLFRRYAHHRGFVAGVAIILLAFAFVCPAMLPTVCVGHQHTCQNQTCWLLASSVVVPVLIVFAWLSWMMRFTLPLEYPLLLFRPPRLSLP
jgi:hypothetical protein